MTSPAGSGHGRVDTDELRQMVPWLREKSLTHCASVVAAAADELDAAREREQRVEAVCVVGEQSPLRYVFAAHLRQALDGGS